MQDYVINDYNDFAKKEIINGKIYLMAGTSTAHDETVGNLRFIFGTYLRGKPCKVYGENMSVNFDKENPQVLPDIKIVCDRSKITKKEIKGPPDLIIEVLSLRTKKRDITEKKDLYEKHGVKEYWIVNTKDRTVEVYLLKEGKYVCDEVYEKLDEDERNRIEKYGTDEDKKLLKLDKIKTSLFGDDLIIDIDDIFYDMIED